MATYPLTWLADVLRAAGCKVIEEDGWKTRGRDGSFTPKAIMLHHDASPKGETSNGVDVIRDGRPGLAGPLSQLWLAYDGTWHVVAAGRANHAGEGGPWGVISKDDGNADAIGIETDHTTDERWSDPQRSEGLRGVHALAQRMGITTRDEIDRAVTAHKEYAPTRKIDPDPMDMDNARAQLAGYTGHTEETFMRLIELDYTYDDGRFYDPARWYGLRLSDTQDPDNAVAKGPFRFLLAAQVYVHGEPGTVVQLRAYKDADGDRTGTYGAVSHTIGPDKWARVALACQGHVGTGSWLRLEARASADADPTDVRTQATLWDE
jgi:hypothetical protein